MVVGPVTERCQCRRRMMCLVEAKASSNHPAEVPWLVLLVGNLNYAAQRMKATPTRPFWRSVKVEADALVVVSCHGRPICRPGSETPVGRQETLGEEG